MGKSRICWPEENPVSENDLVFHIIDQDEVPGKIAEALGYTNSGSRDIYLISSLTDKLLTDAQIKNKRVIDFTDGQHSLPQVTSHEIGHGLGLEHLADAGINRFAGNLMMRGDAGTQGVTVLLEQIQIIIMVSHGY